MKRKAGTGKRKMPTRPRSLIVYYGFTQTHIEVNALNLDNRLNQRPILLFDIY